MTRSGSGGRHRPNAQVDLHWEKRSCSELTLRPWLQLSVHLTLDHSWWLELFTFHLIQSSPPFKSSVRGRSCTTGELARNPRSASTQYACPRRKIRLNNTLSKCPPSAPPIGSGRLNSWRILHRRSPHVRSPSPGPHCRENHREQTNITQHRPEL